MEEMETFLCLPLFRGCVQRVYSAQYLDFADAGLMPTLTALRLRVQSSLHLLPSTTGLFKKISGLSLAKKKRVRVRSIERNKKDAYFLKAFKTIECIKLIHKN